MSKFEILEWIAAAGLEPILSDTGDLDVKAVLATRGTIKGTVADVLAEIDDVWNDPSLSALGQKSKAASIAAKAMSTVRGMGAMEASRAALQARIAKAPVPGIDSVPAAFIGPVVTLVQAMDPLLIPTKALEYLDKGDTSVCTVLVHMPASISPISEADRVMLANALRVKTNGGAAAAADALAKAIAAVDLARGAALQMISKAARIVDEPALVNT